MTTTDIEIRETDGKGRMTLPREFANSTLMLEVVSDTEIVIRKAKVVPLTGSEQIPPLTTLLPLSDSARDAFLAALDGPVPDATPAMKRAIAAAKTAG